MAPLGVISGTRKQPIQSMPSLDDLAKYQELINSLSKGLFEKLWPGFARAETQARLLPEPRVSGYTPSFDGTQIYWEMHGPAPETTDKRPMVFCYGLVCAMPHWRHQIARYSPEHPCLLIDYRGHHRSAHPMNPELMNLGAVARDVSAAMEAQHFGQPAQV